MNGFTGGIVGGAVVRLFLDPTQFNAAWKASEAEGRASAKRMEGSYSKLGVAANAAFMVAQAAVVAFIASGVKAALEYEKAFQRIGAISNTSADNLAVWKDGLLEISRTTSVPATELADALYFLSSAGLEASEIMPTLEASAKAAAVGLGTTADIAKITANALNAYAGTGLTAAQVTDTLVAAVREGSADPEEFATALGRILPAARAAGIGFDEVTASLAVLSNIGLDVNEGVTAMRGLFLALTSPTQQASDALRSVGITTDELRAIIRDKGIIAALQELEDATGGNLDTMKKIIPNVRALTGALGLTGQAANKVDAVFKATLESTGSLSDAFEATMKGPAKQLETSFNALALAGLEVGIKLVPALVVVGKALGVVADQFEILLALLLSYKVLTASWLPTLFQNIAGGLAGMGAAGALASEGMLTAGVAAQGLGASLKTAFPWLLALTAAWMALSAAMPTEQERMADLNTRASEALKASVGDAVKTQKEIDAKVAEYIRMGGYKRTGLGKLEPLRTPQEIEAYRKSLEDEAKSLAVAELSVTDFSKASGGMLKSVAPLASLLGKSYSDMAMEIKAALQGTESREKTWAEFTEKTLLDARQAIQKWRDETTDALNFVDDRFAELAGDGVGSMSKIVSELKKALQDQIKFNDNLTIIANRAKQYGVDASRVLQTFIDQGPAAADTVAAFASSGKESFLEVLDLMGQAQTDARSTTNTIQSEIVGTLQDIRDLLEKIAIRWGVKIDVDVDDSELNQLLYKMQREGIPTTFTVQTQSKTSQQYGGALAAGGIIAAANGIVRQPTFLVGEGSYATRWGTGAELVQPLNERTLERLGSAIGAYTVKVQGSSSSNTTIVNIDGAVSPLDVAQNLEWWRRTSGR